ncbi:MAG: alpha-glucan family phosphorylase [Ignavibacteria bacterium]|nr:alpha-glucan family phosphorylase [Ignavibacteria bacterium]
MQIILNQLKELSYNLYWSWNNDFYSIFDEINHDYWKWSNRNPVKFLDAISDEYLFDIIERKNLQEKIHSLYRDFKTYLNEETYFEKNYYKPTSPSVCYFSTEYGIAKCLKFYSGGLGTLSGDHLKSSSDLGIPLIGIGLAYTYGYFRQFIDKNDRQSELYEKNNFDKLPMYLVTDDNFRPLKISINLPGRKVFAQIWVINVGRVRLYLLDTFVDENNADDKRITDILYGGDIEERILQEIFLGIGGMRVLEALKFDIKAFHINEGHSAFLCFERIQNCMKKNNLSFKEAKERCYYSNIFTTHTPVPAGIDIFPRGLMDKYFRRYAEEEMNISFEELFDEGNLTKGQPDNDKFNMAYLAINNSNFVNAVSKSHGEIARKMWALPETRSQIDSITNGVHIKTYLSRASEKLYKKHFGKDWFKEENIWEKVSKLPDEAIWDIRKQNRLNMIKFIREKISDKMKLIHESDEKLSEVKDILDEKVLTIGFARRFATYKRGTLLFRDIERLKKIILNENMSVQFVFSGKAHPQDDGGKHLISEILSYSKQNEFKNKLVFLENYDIAVAKELVYGCDVWLNSPRRPLEASGTSGMKIVANGGLNFSILDGWWNEGYSEENGWKIDSSPDEKRISYEEEDIYEANSLYDTLENEILPSFYIRDDNGIPLKWIHKIKTSIRNLAEYFNTERMVKEYNEKFYMKVK